MLRSLRIPFVLLFVLTSCSSESVFIPRIEDTNFAPSLGVDLATSTKTASGLWYREVFVGTGAEVPSTSGTSVVVAYTGYFRNGEEFNSGTDAFSTGGTGLDSRIAGYDEGVRGMRVGGRRQLIIPPALGYGSQPYGEIPANSILVFVIDLVSIN